jgi:hypothetical protein
MADDIERQAGTGPETEGGGEAQDASTEQAAGGQDVDSGQRDVIGGRTGSLLSVNHRPRSTIPSPARPGAREAEPGPSWPGS